MKKKTKNILLGIVLLGIIGAGVGWYLIQQKLKPTEVYIRHCDNARRIHEQMVEFEMDYLGLPSAEAMADDDEMSVLDLSTSNGYLGQLVIAAAMDSEEIFFLEGSSCCVGSAPDNKVTPRTEVLCPGENGWAYFKGRELDGDGTLPLLVPGWNPKTKKWDEDIWKTGIPVLRVDGSVVLYQAPKEGKIKDYDVKKGALPFSHDDPDLVQPAHAKK